MAAFLYPDFEEDEIKKISDSPTEEVDLPHIPHYCPFDLTILQISVEAALSKPSSLHVDHVSFSKSILDALPNELLLQIFESQSPVDQVIFALTCTKLTRLFIHLHPTRLRRMGCSHNGITWEMRGAQNLPLPCILLSRLPSNSVPSFLTEPSGISSWKFCRNTTCHKPWPTVFSWWISNMERLSELPDIVGYRRLQCKRSFIWWCIENWCGEAQGERECEEASLECPECYGRWRTEGKFSYTTRHMPGATDWGSTALDWNSLLMNHL